MSQTPTHQHLQKHSRDDALLLKQLFDDPVLPHVVPHVVKPSVRVARPQHAGVHGAGESLETKSISS